jgi:hypothetical protein
VHIGGHGSAIDVGWGIVTGISREGLGLTDVIGRVGWSAVGGLMVVVMLFFDIISVACKE